ncbi:MAG TPA: glycosyltransferase family 4 protein [Verrucomicrobiae bacterium]
MNCWIVNVTEPIPELDEGARPFRCSYLAKELNARGHSVVWWTSTFRHYTKDFRAQKFTKIPGDLLSFRLLHGPGYKRNRSPRRLIHHDCEAVQFRNEATSRSERTPDLIFVTLPTLSLASVAVTIAADFGRSAVLDVNDCWPDHYLNVLPRLLRPLARPLLSNEYRNLRNTLQNAAAVTAISKTYLDWAHSNAITRDTNRDRVYPIGCRSPQRDSKPVLFPEILTRCGLTSKDFIVLFAGTLGPAFDFQAVLRAAGLLRLRCQRNVQFVFAGTGPEEKRLRREASNRPNVKVLGWIQNHEILQQVVASAQLGLCPYKEGAFMSLPNKPFEFMAAGKPLVSSLRGELWEIIEREKIGVNYEPSDAASLAASIAEFTRDRVHLQRISRQSRMLFENSFDADSIYFRFAVFLEDVAAEGRDPAAGKNLP